ncbi:hypothetical protein ANN_05836 [Periplaneta americana]|uniref:Uncharacterized protein n=1 Tax=Periplaneta americana TaxID=6978 RepID=A0ABQ8TE05_PERAM|nr:hypothetical protein ANN_05836 [Periplaneta americana]
MAGLCEGGNEPPDSLKASKSNIHVRDGIRTNSVASAQYSNYEPYSLLPPRPARAKMAAVNWDVVLFAPTTD